MPINFPDSPAENDSFTSGGKKWIFNGTVWTLVTANSYTIPTGEVTAEKLASGVAVSNIGYTPANVASPTFTGTVVLPSTTSIGTVSSTELSYVDGVTSSIQTQLDTKAAISSLVPVGVISAYAGSSAPSGWLMCAGQAVSRSTYAALFTALSTTYGVGDGSTTFNLPDLRGRVPAGVDNMGGSAASRLTSTVLTASNTLGATGGTQTHTLTDAQVPPTEVRVNDGSNFWPLFGAGGGSTGGYLGRPATEFPNAFGAGQRPAIINGGGGAHTNTQPTLVLNYIIKATQ